MRDTVAKALLHLLNWIAVLFALVITCPQYEHITGLIAALSLVEA